MEEENIINPKFAQLENLVKEALRKQEEEQG